MNTKYWFLTYIIIRILDVISTYLNMDLTDSWESIELAPASYLGIKSFGFWPFIVWNIILSILIFVLLYKNKLGKYALISFMFLNVLVVIMNFTTYFLALNILVKASLCL